MLSTEQKYKILQRAGHPVPGFVGLAGEGPARAQWEREVENAYVSYVAARAARSLREAEEARQLETLRRMASLSTSAMLQPA